MKSDDLEIHVEHRKRQLISEIIEHKKNSSRSGAAEAIGKLKLQLSELSQIMCGPLSPAARMRLTEWMAR